MNKDIEIEKGILKKKRGWIRDNIALVSIIAIAACLRIYKIDYQSLWVDEIHTLNETNPEFSFSEMYSALLRAEPHPQLYFVLVHFAFKIFGYSSLVLRLFSAVVGVAGVISMYFLGREIFNRKTGLYAAILIAFNYFHLFYSQEARMYALFFLCTTLSFYFFIRFLKRPTTKSCLIYTFFALTMAYSHFFGLFSLASQYLILLFFIIKPITSTGLRLFYLSLMSGIITFICYLPNYYIIERSAGVTSSP